MRADHGVVLYGPPASGKDTVTKALIELAGKYAHFQRLKAGAGRTSGYRVVTATAMRDLGERGDLLYVNERYDAIYGVDRTGLDIIVERGQVPILHIGQVDGIQAVVGDYRLHWVVVCLWCDRGEADRRLVARHDLRPVERLAAWDATVADFRGSDPSTFDLMINTETIEAHEAARIIDSCCQ